MDGNEEAGRSPSNRPLRSERHIGGRGQKDKDLDGAAVGEDDRRRRSADSGLNEFGAEENYVVLKAASRAAAVPSFFV